MVFYNESSLHIRWPKYWNFSISPSKEYSGLISFRIDWFDLLAVQGTLKSLLQHHNSDTSILKALNFFYGPTFTSVHDYWKTHVEMHKQGYYAIDRLFRVRLRRDGMERKGKK